MALKDWKKYGMHDYRSKKQIIEFKGSLNFLNNNKIYDVEIYDVITESPFFKKEFNFVRHFKAKSQALKFAKEYMRKH